MYLESLGDGVLDACCGLHVFGHGLIHSRSWSRGQDAMLESLCVASEAPLLGRKNRFLILQSPLHYELILERAERPGSRKHRDVISHRQIFLGDYRILCNSILECISKKSQKLVLILGNIWGEVRKMTT